MFYKKFKLIWDNKDVVIVTCKNVVDKIEYNIFDNCSDIKYIFTPSTNAWSEYEKIYKEILKYNTSVLIIVMVGATSKVLVYDLSSCGYRALDLGHLMKSYDYYMKKN